MQIRSIKNIQAILPKNFTSNHVIPVGPEGAQLVLKARSDVVVVVGVSTLKQGGFVISSDAMFSF